MECKKRKRLGHTKTISDCKIIHPWERPLHSYNLKPYYHASSNLLWIDIYLSTSEEFNNRKFYDPYEPASSYDSKKRVKLAYLTKNRFNENYLPWHSSAFVFNGDVKEVKLKALDGYYRFNLSTTNKKPAQANRFIRIRS